MKVSQVRIWRSSSMGGFCTDGLRAKGRDMLRIKG